MKTWKTPEIEEIKISTTEHNWCGIFHDGGYIGDGIISGHGSWRPVCPEKPVCPKDHS